MRVETKAENRALSPSAGAPGTALPANVRSALRTAPLPTSRRGRFCILSILRSFLRIRSEPLDWKAVGARVVVVAPHADDESLGAGGLIHRRAAAGLPTDVIVVTDSNASRPDDQLRTALNLTRLRRNEAIRAANALELPLDHLHFLGLLEGRLPKLPREEYLALRNTLVEHLRRMQPDAVFLPHYDDGHVEHAAVYELVKSACGEFPGLCVYSFPIWSAWSPPLLLRHILNRRRVFRLPHGGGHTDAKARALAAYETQFVTQPPFPAPVMPKGFMRIFVESDEYFFCD